MLGAVAILQEEGVVDSERLEAVLRRYNLKLP
jgi:hypothetical protein